jgi:colanic acid/amylovoran biosynthesis glycosyltransferase
VKVALVVNTFPSLSETFIYNHAAGLRAAGVDVTVFASRASADAPLFADFDGVRYDGPVHYLPLARTPRETAQRTVAELASAPRRGMQALRAARRLYGTSKRGGRAWLFAMPLRAFDIVHIEYSGLAVQWIDALPLLAPARVIVSCRGAAEQITPLVDRSRADQLRAVFERCDRAHCVSTDMLRTCERYGLVAAKAFVNRPAIDAGRFTRRIPYVARDRGPYRLLSTGRLHWKKGLEYALLAVRRLVDAGHEVHYDIIGGGADEERLRFAIHDLGLAASVTMCGRRSSTEIRTALERADVYLLPSLSEGLSNAALEAMAMAVPVVSTTAGGMAEAITDGVDGVLVPPRDPAAMADRIADLLRDARRRSELGAAARARVEADFTLERQIRTFVEVYRSLL